MKKILVHWVEMRTYELPDEAPTDNEDELFKWIFQHPKAKGDLEYFTISADTRDWEIVDIQN